MVAQGWGGGGLAPEELGAWATGRSRVLAVVVAPCLHVSALTLKGRVSLHVSDRLINPTQANKTNESDRLLVGAIKQKEKVPQEKDLEG